ncbi:hypothetical protein RN001_003715 [Aquatica leii]|uniref:Mutator-like transposase domain-containing protein n=1 Tax=Aquatica leii TaxID=1421715 RepID=A0AAN7SMG4_9COLE|nr:hypothetical protein RN001_003715 [Aquatica leii]
MLSVCLFGGEMILVETVHHYGIASVLKFACSKLLCSDTASVHTADATSLNADAVWSGLGIGIGFSQAEEFCAVLQTPYMCNSTYFKYERTIGQPFKNLETKKLQNNIDEEKQAAVSAGNISKEGHPCISVIVDGGWGKRSYGHAYNSNTGAAYLGNSNLNKGTEILTEHQVMDYITFTNIVGPETIKKFEALHDIVPKDAYQDFLNLYKIWNWFGNRSDSLEQNTPGTEEIQILEKPQLRFPDRENINNGNEAKCRICGKLIRASKKMISCKDCKVKWEEALDRLKERLKKPQQVKETGQSKPAKRIRKKPSISSSSEDIEPESPPYMDSDNSGEFWREFEDGNMNNTEDVDQTVTISSWVLVKYCTKKVIKHFVGMVTESCDEDSYENANQKVSQLLETSDLSSTEIEEESERRTKPKHTSIPLLPKPFFSVNPLEALLTADNSSQHRRIVNEDDLNTHESPENSVENDYLLTNSEY